MAFIILCRLRLALLFIALIFCSNNLFAQALPVDTGTLRFELNPRTGILHVIKPSDTADIYKRKSVIKVIKNGLKSNLTGILISAGISALLDYMGWFIDEETGDLMYIPDGTRFKHTSVYNDKEAPDFATPEDACMYIVGRASGGVARDLANFPTFSKAVQLPQSTSFWCFFKNQEGLEAPIRFAEPIQPKPEKVTPGMIDAIPDDEINPSPADIPLINKGGLLNEPPDAICRLNVRKPKKRRPDLDCPDCDCQDGKDGADGKDGKDGETGEKGETGESGKDGKNGDDGNDGRDGKDGKPGKTGKTGKSGDDGDDGEKGEKGDTGKTGKEGDDGDDGEKGDKGDTGKTGKDGDDGDDGKDGKPKKKDDDDCSICNLRKDLKKYFDDNFDKEEPKLPKIIDQDYTRRRTIDLGSASCPAPYQINLNLVGMITFNYQPICDVASIARFFVLISSAVMSVYILLGVQHRG